MFGQNFNQKMYLKAEVGPKPVSMVQGGRRVVRKKFNNKKNRGVKNFILGGRSKWYIYIYFFWRVEWKILWKGGRAQIFLSRKTRTGWKMQNIIKTERKNCVIACNCYVYTLRPEVSTTYGKGCFDLSQTYRHTDKHTDRQTDMATLWLGSIQWKFVLYCLLGFVIRGHWECYP